MERREEIARDLLGGEYENYPNPYKNMHPMNSNPAKYAYLKEMNLYPEYSKHQLNQRDWFDKAQTGLGLLQIDYKDIENGVSSMKQNIDQNIQSFEKRQIFSSLVHLSEDGKPSCNYEDLKRNLKPYYLQNGI